MASTSATQIKQPANEQDFESHCQVLWQCILNDPNVQKVGRRGQAQRGVDLWGVRDQDLRKPVGIQCKLKSGRSLLSEKEVRHEFGEALKFRPALTEYYILTTSPDDRVLQELAYDLAVEQLEAGRKITFYIWGWNAITEKVARYPDAMKAFDPTYGVYSGEIRSDVQAVRIELQASRVDNASGLHNIANELTLLRHAVLSDVPERTSGIVTAVEVQIDAEIDGYRALADGGKVVTALEQFKKLLSRVRDTSSGRILFRIKANIGNCLLHQGKNDEAADLLLEAFSHANSEPKAIANKAFALLLKSDWHGVLEMGRENLVSELADEALSSHVVQAARFVEGISEPLLLVPEKDRGAAGVLISYSHFLRAREDERWQKVAREAAERYPDDQFAKRLSAEAALEIVSLDPSFLKSGRLSPAQKSDLEDAVSKLLDLWNFSRASEGELDGGDVAICCNLLLGYRLLGARAQAMALVREALPIMRHEQDFLLRAVGNALEAGDRIIDDLLPDLAEGPDKLLVVIQLSVARNDWQTLLSVNKSDIDELPASERAISKLALEIAAVAVSPPKDIERVLMAMVHDSALDPRLSILVAQFCDSLKQDGLSFRAWRNARTEAGKDVHHSSLFMTAMYAARKGYWSDAADLLYGHVDPSVDTEELRSLALALVNEQPVRELAKTFFETLPDNIAETQFYRRAKARMYYNYGAVTDAEQATRTLLDSSPDIDSVLMMLMILRRLDRAAESEALLSMPGLLHLSGSPGDKLELSQELARVGRGEDAIRYAYSVLRQNPDDSAVARQYAILILGSDDTVPIPEVKTVGLDCWVMLRNEQGREFSFVIEDGEDKPSQGILGQHHAYSVGTIGKEVGHSFLEERAFGDRPSWEIQAIKHKYLFALHDILENYQHRFPGAGGLWVFTTKDNDIEPILAHVKGVADTEKARAELYTKHQIPFHMVARKYGQVPIQLADYVRAEGGVIRACSGLDAELRKSISTIVDYRGQGVVFDTYSAWIAAGMDILDVLRDIFGEIYIPQSVFDDLLVLRGWETFPTYPGMSLSWIGGSFVREEMTREGFDARKAFIQKQLDIIKAGCMVQAVAAPNERNRIAEIFLANFGSHVMDSAVLASRGHLLVSEDMHHRGIAERAYSVAGVWIQPVLLWAVENGLMDRERYLRKLVELAHLKHAHVTINSLILSDLLYADKSGSLEDFEVVADFIGIRDADIVSHATVISAFAEYIDLSKVPAQLYLRAFGVLLWKLLRYRSEDWHYVTAYLYDRLGLQERDYVYNWLKGHFLDPNPVAMARRTMRNHSARYAVASILADSGSYIRTGHRQGNATNLRKASAAFSAQGIAKYRAPAPPPPKKRGRKRR